MCVKELMRKNTGKELPYSKDSGNDFRVPEIASDPVCFCSIFL